MRNLDQEARAVAGIVLASTRAAMVEIIERGQAVADDLVRFPAFQVDDEAHPAAIVFVSRVVQTLEQVVGRYSSVVVLR